MMTIIIIYVHFQEHKTFQTLYKFIKKDTMFAFKVGSQ